jgi:tRNA (guanine-N(7)-)-methyltransferase subunit TRM82
VTCDRDEKIRITRYPKTHLIHGFCLGHQRYFQLFLFNQRFFEKNTHQVFSFVSTIHLPCTRPKWLLSGGGDHDVFLWDWKACRLLHRFPVAPLLPETDDVDGFGGVRQIVSNQEDDIAVIFEEYVYAQPIL